MHLGIEYTEKLGAMIRPNDRHAGQEAKSAPVGAPGDNEVVTPRAALDFRPVLDMARYDLGRDIAHSQFIAPIADSDEMGRTRKQEMNRSTERCSILALKAVQVTIGRWTQALN